MRIGSTVLFIDGYCYQSYSWNLLRPLGNLQNIINHLDKYLIDDITIIRPVRKNDSKSSFLRDIKELRKLKSSTPISFGGGIREINRLKLLEGLPFERFVFSSLLFNENSDVIYKATELFGKQAIVGLVPFKLDAELSVFNSSIDKFISPNQLLNLSLCDEIILHDCINEGNRSGFLNEVVKKLNLKPKSCVLSGGISNLVNKIKKYPQPPKAVSIENSVLYKEFSKINYHEKL